MNEQVSVAGLLAEGGTYLAAAGVEAPAYDARVLLAHVLDANLSQVLLHPACCPEAAETRAYRHLVALRATRMPLQYVTRNSFFCGLELRSDPRALIPRSETELLAEAMVERLEGLSLDGADYVVDVGCGSGALGFALLSMIPALRLLATDVSDGALQLAGENAEHLGLAPRVRYARGAYLAPVHELELTERVVAVVCNPPYVRPAEMPSLDPEVLWEPDIALKSSSADGLGEYREMARQVRELPQLRLLGFEVGFKMAPAVRAMVTDLGEVEVLRDYADIERMVIVYVN